MMNGIGIEISKHIDYVYFEDYDEKGGEIFVVKRIYDDPTLAGETIAIFKVKVKQDLEPPTTGN